MISDAKMSDYNTFIGLWCRGGLGWIDEQVLDADNQSDMLWRKKMELGAGELADFMLISYDKLALLVSMLSSEA